MRDDEELERQVRSLDAWFQNFDLGSVKTAPDHPLGDYPSVKWDRFSWAIPLDLTGISVLEVGCNAGFYAFEMKKRGQNALSVSTTISIICDKRSSSVAGCTWTLNFGTYPSMRLKNCESNSTWSFSLGSSTTSGTRCSLSICCAGT
jgi:hypothetical protein